MEKAAQELEWSKAQEIALSVDLVKAAEQQLKFLAAVDSFHCLYDGPLLDHAIYRYKFCWLPLLAKHVESPLTRKPLVVPIDCEWIWHCHRLNPVQYNKDCKEIYGRILDNFNVLSILTGTCTEESEQLWKLTYPTESYHLELKRPFTMNFIDIEGAPRSTNYDLVGAVKRQSSFFRKMSKSIVHDNWFLEEAVTRYKAFLQLIKTEEERPTNFFYVPTYDIDLIWHSHQLHPHSYDKDLKAIFGKMLDHNDRDSDVMKIKTGFRRTMKLWEETFGHQYKTAGTMYTSECTIECLNSFPGQG